MQRNPKNIKKLDSETANSVLSPQAKVLLDTNNEILPQNSHRSSMTRRTMFNVNNSLATQKGQGDFDLNFTNNLKEIEQTHIGVKRIKV